MNLFQTRSATKRQQNKTLIFHHVQIDLSNPTHTHTHTHISVETHKIKTDVAMLQTIVSIGLMRGRIKGDQLTGGGDGHFGHECNNQRRRMAEERCHLFATSLPRNWAELGRRRWRRRPRRRRNRPGPSCTAALGYSCCCGCCCCCCCCYCCC